MLQPYIMRSSSPPGAVKVGSTFSSATSREPSSARASRAARSTSTGRARSCSTSSNSTASKGPWPARAEASAHSKRPWARAAALAVSSIEAAWRRAPHLARGSAGTSSGDQPWPQRGQPPPPASSAPRSPPRRAATLARLVEKAGRDAALPLAHVRAVAREGHAAAAPVGAPLVEPRRRRDHAAQRQHVRGVGSGGQHADGASGIRKRRVSRLPGLCDLEHASHRCCSSHSRA